MAKTPISKQTTTLPREAEWTVMFIDLVGSTELKYKVGAEKVAGIITDLFEIIKRQIETAKFTGDGAMAIFKKTEQGANRALSAAEWILQQVDTMNMRFAHPRIHIRIGIATGECYQVNRVGTTELSGKTADLAARLEGEAEIDSILIDETTKADSGFPGHRFTHCDRRLSLRGVPYSTTEKHESFYFFKANRLLRPPKEDHFSKGLLALYPDRPSLFRDLSAVRLIFMAKPASTILIAGRTLKHWTQFGSEIRWAIERGIKFHLVMSSEELARSDAIRKQLEPKQIADMLRDLADCRNYFLDLATEMAAVNKARHFQLRETDYLILDGITCVRIVSPGSKPEEESKLITLQDINAAPGENKATFVLACRCNSEKESGKEWCMAHGLYKRTNLIFAKSRESRVASKPVERIVRLHREDGGARNNSPTKYVNHIKDYFPLIKADELNRIPAPLCVQLQVSSTCSTNCRMCDHWKKEVSPNEEPPWKDVFKDLAGFGVKSVIFSGGEPLMRADIAELIESASAHGLRIGLLTNGSMPHRNPQERKGIISSIKTHVDWVAISIDGTPAEDLAVRRPNKEFIEDRCALVKEFCNELRGGRPRLSATVTLQKKNIEMNLKNVIRFIKEDIGIDRVNFKLATGSKKALDGNPDFLLSREQLTDLETFLWNNALVQNDDNNLDYLRRCFADGVFDIEAAKEGHPVSEFYEAQKLRCHTPFLFSLIDTDGSVYPCCHLYRDNHGSDRNTAGFRQDHLMGNVRENPFGAIWNGDKYANERKRLKTIEPHAKFSPCGECTRHCQHNRVLTQIYREFEKDPSTLDQLKDQNTDNQPVWF